MNVQQTRTLMLRTQVKINAALEALLTAIATQNMFNGVDAAEIVDVIVTTMTPDEDTRLDMVAYLESEVGKRDVRTL